MKLNKKIAVLLGIMFLMVALGGWRNLRSGISVGDKFLVRKSEGYYKGGDDEIRMIKGAGFTNFQIVMNGEEKTAGLVWSKNDSLFNMEHDYAEITYQDGTIVEGHWLGDAWSDSNLLVNDEGMPLIYLGNPIVIIADGEEPPISNEVLSNVLCRLDFGLLEKNGSGAFIVLGMVVYLFGTLTFLYPEKMFFLGSRWQFKNPKLSEEGEFMEQVCGVICMAMGVFIALNIGGWR